MFRKITFYFLILFCGVCFSTPFFNHQIVSVIYSIFEIPLNTEFWNFGLQHLGIELIVLSGILLLNIFTGERYKFLLPAIILIILFFVFLFQYAVNIPIIDDYYAILGFSNQYFIADNAAEKFSLLVSFYDECRLIITRITIIILHFITGEVNIKWLIIIFNCCLPLILFIFYKSIRYHTIKFRLEIILMLAFLIFHFAYYDAILFATAGIHYQFVILFIMLALYFICEKSITAQVAGAIAAIMAILSFGNGWLIFPLAILYFVIEKRWKLFFAWMFTGIIFLILYFNNPLFLKVGISFFSITDYIIYSCCFLGGAFQFMYKLHLPFIAGFLIWILFAILTVKKYYRKNFFIYALILFVILSSLITAHFRLNFGLSRALSNRYGIFSLIVFSASLIAVFEIINEKKQRMLYPVLLSLCIVYHMLSGIFFFPEVPIRKQKLETFIINIKNNKPFTPVVPIIPEDADIIVKESIEKKLYFP